MPGCWLKCSWHPWGLATGDSRSFVYIGGPRESDGLVPISTLHCMFHFSLSLRQHQLVPISTPLHASLSTVPTSTPVGTHINTTACVTFSSPDVNTDWYPYQHHYMLQFQLSLRQHQLVPISTPLHASLSALPTSTPIGTHINTTTCFTFSCPYVNTNWYPYQHHCMFHFQLSLRQHQLVPISTPLHASLFFVPTSTSVGTHIVTTTCFTFSCTEVNTNWYPYQHHSHSDLTTAGHHMRMETRGCKYS